MAPNVEIVKREILMSGVDDWIDALQGISFARELSGGERNEQEALPLVVSAVKSLLREGLVEVGEASSGGFVPWPGAVDEIERHIDEVAASATFPVLFGDLFWISNTSLGDEQGKRLLAQEKSKSAPSD